MPKSKNRKEQKTKAAKRKNVISQAKYAHDKRLKSEFEEMIRKLQQESSTITDEQLEEQEVEPVIELADEIQ